MGPKSALNFFFFFFYLGACRILVLRPGIQPAPTAVKSQSPNHWVSLVDQTGKNSPAMWETWVRSLGWKDPLEEGMATHSSVLAWRIPWTEEPGGCSPWGPRESDTTERAQALEHQGSPPRGL